MVPLGVATRCHTGDHVLGVPDPGSNDHVLRDSLSEISHLRHNYPGLSSLHVNDILSTTIQDLVGWEGRTGRTESDSDRDSLTTRKVFLSLSLCYLTV